jgi:hypothetical protein
METLRTHAAKQNPASASQRAALFDNLRASAGKSSVDDEE